MPEGWAWTNWGTISYLSGFQSVKAIDVPLDSWVLELEDIEKESGILLEKVYKNYESQFKSNKYSFKKGDILYSKLRPYLQKILIADQGGYATTEIIPISIYHELSTRLYYNWLFSNHIFKLIDSSTYGVNLPRVNVNFLKSILIPIAPISEQVKLSERIDYHLTQIKLINDEQESLQQLSEQLKKRVLDTAMRGKLVPQDSDDEPASILLKRIREEKQKLYEEGKLKKKDLEESIIYKGDDNSYYEKSRKRLENITELVHYNLPTNWIYKPISELIYTKSIRNIQIKQSDINIAGEYPVISQSEKFIEGYSNETEKVLELDSPVIVFGDHTRNVKLVNFNFIVGADGVKIIYPITIDTTYLYYAILNALQFVNDRGYARHYSYLIKEIIGIPPEGLQRKIVKSIRKLERKLSNLTS